MEGKKTPLYQTHVEAGAKIVEFGGWLMPVQYSGIIEEHHAVRKKAGLFDVSHMGEFSVKGKDALAFLQKVVTNDVGAMDEGQVQYTPMCYPDGGTVDDLLIYKIADGHYFLVVNAGNMEKDWGWLNDNKEGFSVELENLSEQTALLALQGPLAEKILGTLTAAELPEVGYYRFLTAAQVAGASVMLSRTGYTGEDGFEIYCRNDDVVPLWHAILEAGASDGILPAGLGCRDTLRFEACLPLYGHELSPEITPVEAGIGMFVKPDKGDFTGKEVLAAQKKDGVSRRIAGFAMVDRGIARADYPVLVDGKVIGWVTTGSVAPTVGKNLGLALIAKEYGQPGQAINIEIRGKLAAAEIIAKPFYKREGK